MEDLSALSGAWILKSSDKWGGGARPYKNLKIRNSILKSILKKTKKRDREPMRTG